ncbi:leukocyte elastase inhibitor-like [Ylistrum balloti]|uniref:leukocyte elastase inhibitor-like n=1 Tax=Ylistrum balloti TaxID=509963 RepID=UPI002905EEFD|nr:leukocyte elastase inhibitor-like [Ylistrum balloti]
MATYQQQQQQQQPVMMLTTYSDGVTEFTCDLYREVCRGEAINSVLSPYSVSAALMLAMLGTEGTSRRQIIEVLCLNDVLTENIHEEYRKLHSELNETGSDVLRIANKIFSKEGLKLKIDYTENSKLYYGSEMELLNFGEDPEGSRKTINDWVEAQTNNKIQDLIPAGSINALSLIVLANAIYFKGSWETKFPLDSTSKRNFHVSLTESMSVDMMKTSKLTIPFGWFGKYDCTAVELPYQGKRRSMVILLPNSVDGLSKIEDNLSVIMINEIVKGMRRQEIEVALPKFKIEANFDLKRVLSKLGIQDVFSAGNADLSGMFDSPPADAHISDVVHKAFVEVNEEGTEAAAATAIMVRAMSITQQFVADHPFVFVIRDVISGTVLFIGKFTRPSLS